MIKDAIRLQDAELFDKLDKYRVDYWKSIINQQHDLIHYGGFSYQDTEGLPLIEFREFMTATIERKKEDDESLATNIGVVIAKMMGMVR